MSEERHLENTADSPEAPEDQNEKFAGFAKEALDQYR